MSPDFGERERAAAARLIELALAEDLGARGDITTQLLIPPAEMGVVHLVARQSGWLSGLPILAMVFAQIDQRVHVVEHGGDAELLSAGDRVATLSGATAALLTGERTALNFLTHLSGIATLTRRFVEAAYRSPAAILDTRKTLPGWRVLQKYAVRCGGGRNHRLGLYDGILIKDNHLAAWRAEHAAAGERSIAAAIEHARRKSASLLPIEVEVDSLEQLEDALQAQPDIVLLDNFTVDHMRAAVAMRNQRAPSTDLEASGGVNLETIESIAATGVDRISIGALTHSAPALDLAFDWEMDR